MKKTLFVCVLMSIFVLHAAFAQEPAIMLSDKPGWHKIGEVKADFEAENESILVFGADKFKSLLLKVTDASINIESMQVFYESGEMEEFDVKKELKPNSETSKLDLKDGPREIKKVVFTYKTEPNSEDEKAHVELHGLK